MNAKAETAGTPGARLVDKALNLIDLIGREPGRRRAHGLARELDLPRSTAYRILTVLQQRGMVRLESGGDGYFPGFRFLEYAGGVWPLGDLPLLALVEIRALAALTGETVWFAVPDGDDMVAIQRAEGGHPVRARVGLGDRLPAVAAAAGRACLANEPREEQMRRLARAGLEPVQALAQFDLIRVRRYAMEEDAAGMRCVAAAALDESGAPIGAFALAGPPFRLTAERANQLGPELAAAADRLAQALRPRRGRARPGAGEAARPASDHRAARGVSPVWDAGSRRLLWLDSLAPALRGADEAGRSSLVAAFDAPATALAPLDAGRWLVTTAAGARLFAEGRIEPCWPLAPAALLAAATGACAADGAVMIAAAGGDARSGLYRLGADGATLALELEHAPSSLLFDEAGRRFLIACADSGDILATDGFAAPRALLRVDPIHGRPAALAMDSAGFLWIALRDGWAVARVAPDGGDMRLLPLSAPRPSGLAFGGEDGETLFVTSERAGLSPQQLADAPASGALFAIGRAERDRLLR